MSISNENNTFEEKIEISNYAECKGLKKVHEYLKHKYVIIVLASIIIIQCLFNMNKISFYSKYFFNKDGDFQWLAITGLAAVGTFLFTSINTARKNKADLVAKSRIEWIQEVRGLMAIFLGDIPVYNYSLIRYNKTSSNDTKFFNEINEILIKIQGTENLLLLHLSSNTDNNQIIDCIKACAKLPSDLKEILIIEDDKMKKEQIETFKKKESIMLNNLMIISRDYFKREWEIAKKGK